MKVHGLLFIVFYLWNIIVKLRTTGQLVLEPLFVGHLSFPRSLKIHLSFGILLKLNKLYDIGSM